MGVYYLGLVGDETMDNFLSCTRRALTASTPKLWLGADCVLTWTKVEKVLEAVGSVLDEPSRRVNSSYIQPVFAVFLRPRIKSSSPIPLTSPAQAECMCFLQDKAAATDFMMVDRGGYLQLTLAYDAVEGGTIREGAHRFVLWSIFGPPPDDEWVVMHYCCNASCLSPFHMVWGTRGENLEDARLRRVPAAHAERRLIERFRTR